VSDTVQASAPRKTLRRRAVWALRQADWKAGKYDRTKRLRDLIDAHGQRDWGHRLMTLTGRNDSGSWGAPRGRDIYMRVGWERREDRTAIDGTQFERVITTDAMTAWDGVQRGEEWRTFDWQDDGTTIRVGWLGDDGRLHDSGLTGSKEIRLFRRWLIWDGWIKAEWFGLRRWLYYKGLHAAVHQRGLRSCNALPPRGSGGYDHWYCQVRRPLLAVLSGNREHHDGPHQFNNMRWDDSNLRVQHVGAAR